MKPHCYFYSVSEEVQIREDIYFEGKQNFIAQIQHDKSGYQNIGACFHAKLEELEAVMGVEKMFTEIPESPE